MKKCVNGNCSIKTECAIYHQAKNMEEARGAGGKFERYSCRKGKCEHFVAINVTCSPWRMCSMRGKCKNHSSN